MEILALGAVAALGAGGQAFYRAPGANEMSYATALTSSAQRVAQMRLRQQMVTATDERALALAQIPESLREAVRRSGVDPRVLLKLHQQKTAAAMTGPGGAPVRRVVGFGSDDNTAADNRAFSYGTEDKVAFDSAPAPPSFVEDRCFTTEESIRPEGEASMHEDGVPTWRDYVESMRMRTLDAARAASLEPHEAEGGDLPENTLAGFQGETTAPFYYDPRSGDARLLNGHWNTHNGLPSGPVVMLDDSMPTAVVSAYAPTTSHQRENVIVGFDAPDPIFSTAAVEAVSMEQAIPVVSLPDFDADFVSGGARAHDRATAEPGVRHVMDDATDAPVSDHRRSERRVRRDARGVVNRDDDFDAIAQTAAREARPRREPARRIVREGDVDVVAQTMIREARPRREPARAIVAVREEADVATEGVRGYRRRREGSAVLGETADAPTSANAGVRDRLGTRRETRAGVVREEEPVAVTRPMRARVARRREDRVVGVDTEVEVSQMMRVGENRSRPELRVPDVNPRMAVYDVESLTSVSGEGFQRVSQEFGGVVLDD